jgi:integrase/recombinase XerD
MQRSLLLFENSIHSKSTLKAYKYAMDRFMKHFQLKDFDGLSSMNHKMFQEMVEDYVMYIKSKNLSKSSVSMPINALQLFCDSNDIEIRWKKIRRMIPQQKKRSGKDPYTTENIIQMISFEPNIRNKAIIHFMAASGVRVGAISDLKVKHLTKISDNCMAITVYPDELEEYTTFLTPEATRILEMYFEKRRIDGEFVNNESPIFREQYTFGISPPKPLSLRGIQGVIERILRRTNIRVGFDGKRRNIQLDHGFRKRFNTILKTTDGIKPLLAEKMLGHSIKSIPLDEVYLTPTIEMLFAEYLKGIPELTVDGSQRKEAELERVKKEKSALQKEVTKRIHVESRLQKLETEKQSILKRSNMTTISEAELTEHVRKILKEEQMIKENPELKQ